MFTQIDLVIYRNHLQAAGPLTRGTISLQVTPVLVGNRREKGGERKKSN